MSQGAAMDGQAANAANAANVVNVGNAPRGHTLRVMTYNVRYFGHPTRGIASTGSAFSRIARSLASLDPTPDLVCLQEVRAQAPRATTMNKLWHPEETQLDRVMTELHAALSQAGKPDKYT